MEKIFKSAVVGMGGIGKTHATCIKNNPNAELVCVCDVNKQRADEAAEQFGVPAVYSVKDMLKNYPEIEVVHVTTSGFENGSWHYVPTMECLDAGKHVLVEKPISNNIEEAREMVAYATKKDLYLGCDLNHYFSEPAFRADQLIKDNKVGEQVYALTKVGFNGSAVNVGVADPNSRMNMMYAHTKAFLTHPFSVMRHFSGDITHIQCFMEKPGARKQSGDLMMSIASVNMKFQNGCIGYMLSQRGDACFGLGGWWSYELAGTRGTFCIENCVEKLTFWENGKEPEIMNTGVTDFGATFPIRINAFYEDLVNEVPKEHLRSSGRDALATMEYIFACIESYESGGEVVRPHALPALHGHPTIIH